MLPISKDASERSSGEGGDGWIDGGDDDVDAVDDGSGGGPRSIE